LLPHHRIRVRTDELLECRSALGERPKGQHPLPQTAIPQLGFLQAIVQGFAERFRPNLFQLRLPFVPVFAEVDVMSIGLMLAGAINARNAMTI
jgi:hypothetical protein